MHGLGVGAQEVLTWVVFGRKSGALTSGFDLARGRAASCTIVGTDSQGGAYQRCPVPASPVHPLITENRARFGHRFAALRQGREWTQEQLAETSGFDRKTVNRIENGRHSPSLDRVFVPADALGVAPLELVRWPES